MAYRKSNRRGGYSRKRRSSSYGTRRSGYSGSRNRRMRSYRGSSGGRAQTLRIVLEQPGATLGRFPIVGPDGKPQWPAPGAMPGADNPNGRSRF